MALVRKYRLIVLTGLMVLGIRIASCLVSLWQLLGWLSGGGSLVTLDHQAMADVAYYVDRWLALFPYHSKGNCLDGREFLEPSSYWQSFTVTVIFPQSAASSNHQ